MRRVGLLVTLLMTVSVTAQAADWPVRPVRTVIPFDADGVADVIPRLVVDQVVVENRGGAGGTIGAAANAKAEPDGYAFLINFSAHTIAPACA